MNMQRNLGDPKRLENVLGVPRLSKSQRNQVEGPFYKPPSSEQAGPSSEDISQQPSTQELLQKNTEAVSTIRNRLATGRKETFYFLTVPGILRVLEMIISISNLTVMGFYSTYFEPVKGSTMVPPIYLSSTREVFFLLVNYYTFASSLNFVLGGVFSSMSNGALISSLYPFLLDFLQCLSHVGASTALLFFYHTYRPQMLLHHSRAYRAKRFLAVSGIILAIFHAIGVLYDLATFLRQYENEDERIAATADSPVNSADPAGTSTSNVPQSASETIRSTIAPVLSQSRFVFSQK